MRKGDWIQTYSGAKFYPLDPREEDIVSIDIAHSLSLQCRFAGHCLKFYSIAEHSCHIYDAIEEEYKLHALLHDASEAYLTDVIRPMKQYMGDYKLYESVLEKMIFRKYGLFEEMPRRVKELDHRILHTEKLQNMKQTDDEWSDMAPPLDIELKFWSPEIARANFLRRFYSSLVVDVPFINSEEVNSSLSAEKILRDALSKNNLNCSTLDKNIIF